MADRLIVGDGHAARSGRPSGRRATESAPPLATDGNDWGEIVASLSSFQYWAEAHPDPALIEEYDDVRNGNYEEARLELEEWAAQGRYRVWSGFEILGVEILDVVDDRTVVLMFEQGPGTITEYAGDEVIDESTTSRQFELGVFRKSPFDERWRWLIRGFVVVAD